MEDLVGAVVVAEVALDGDARGRSRGVWADVVAGEGAARKLVEGPGAGGLALAVEVDGEAVGRVRLGEDVRHDVRGSHLPDGRAVEDALHFEKHRLHVEHGRGDLPGGHLFAAEADQPGGVFAGQPAQPDVEDVLVAQVGGGVFGGVQRQLEAVADQLHHPGAPQVRLEQLPLDVGRLRVVHQQGVAAGDVEVQLDGSVAGRAAREEGGDVVVAARLQLGEEPGVARHGVVRGRAARVEVPGLGAEGGACGGLLDVVEIGDVRGQGAARLVGDGVNAQAGVKGVGGLAEGGGGEEEQQEGEERLG